MGARRDATTSVRRRLIAAQLLNVSDQRSLRVSLRVQSVTGEHPGRNTLAGAVVGDVAVATGSGGCSAASRCKPMRATESLKSGNHLTAYIDLPIADAGYRRFLGAGHGLTGNIFTLVCGAAFGFAELVRRSRVEPCSFLMPWRYVPAVVSSSHQSLTPFALWATYRPCKPATAHEAW